MGFLYRQILRKILFTFDPETVHDAVIKSARTLQSIGPAQLIIELMARATEIPVTVAGIRFRNPVGLAAGFDKNCEAPHILARLGFGFLELGTLTLRAQNGNPRPRVFRLGEHQGIINRMGFNNVGAYEAARRLERLGPAGVPLGLNIGKNADCSLEDAPKNYVEALKVLYPFGDYFTLNISSPNTLQLRALHQKERLARLLDPVMDFVSGQAAKKPVFVKISPELEDAELKDLVSSAVERGLGLIVANTTVRRGHLPARWHSYEGGLSGRPLRGIANEMLEKVSALAAGRAPLIGAGGIFDGPSAAEKLRLGADLVQVYSGLIYEGPFLVRAILKYLEKTGFNAQNRAKNKFR
ncbi:MAG: dihydroorotate dehydrogenase (quinone) [Elusimicrobia bacterium GWA2_56_46]|nr:MAG: dihydroorotate dehydrogenase (quinone) [Elusimicrobia bacterium GWA2_56_46]OGR55870.1 MAG: dihydroorotate dehydrogenase (quinone) [Elusimicrobia bacterium GWC2_56_31]HBB66715.1 dihydroorotate dehydrogenase (quinone) [Elusimicrobiota bacterium]HBW22197.1 dihydroorotate dehydrogenase (quinone) [Elusimicrobiota bacterium]